MGRQQPRLPYACKNNTLARVVGFMNASSGTVHSTHMKQVTAVRLAETLEMAVHHYPEAETITVVWDNWPNHHSKKVLEVVSTHPRLRLLPLPTYAPWLNKIEKFWRRLRQDLTHAHPWCDDFREFLRQLRTQLSHYSEGCIDLLRYVGLST